MGGQVLSIDAHNNGIGGDAIFVAFYSRDVPDEGELDIGYEVQNSSVAWRKFYEKACKDAEDKEVISMTGSCNTETKSVFYVFFYKGVVRDLKAVEYLEVRDNSWSGAAQKLVNELDMSGLDAGQILSIDAHNS